MCVIGGLDVGLDTQISAAIRMIRKGRKKIEVVERFGDEVYELAMVRLKYKEKFKRPIYMPLSGFRYATHEVVARYRGRVARERVVADLSCGCGMQAIFFAKYAEKVYAVDIDPRMIRYARMNARLYNAKNIEFIVGDALDNRIKSMIYDADFVFSDPSRPESERRRRLSTLSPPPAKIVEIYDKPYMFDLPPQISAKEITINGRREYISLHGKINRLTLYAPDIAPRNNDVWCVSLPRGAVLGKNDRIDRDYPRASEAYEYIYLVDQAVYYASLLPELCKKYCVEVLSTGKRRTFATSEKRKNSPFFVRVCRRLSGPYKTLEEALRVAKSTGISSPTIHAPISPSEYWKVRGMFGTAKIKGLKGAIIGWKDNYYVCEVI